MVVEVQNYYLMHFVTASLLISKRSFDICFELGTDEGSVFDIYIIANKKMEPECNYSKVV